MNSPDHVNLASDVCNAPRIARLAAEISELKNTRFQVMAWSLPEISRFEITIKKNTDCVGDHGASRVFAGPHPNHHRFRELAERILEWIDAESANLEYEFVARVCRGEGKCSACDQIAALAGGKCPDCRH